LHQGSTGRNKLTGQQVATARHSWQPGRQAGHPHRQRGRSLSTAHAVWRREPPPPTDMPHGLLLCIQSTRPVHTWGEAVATQSLRKAFFCSVQPSCVHDRERPRDSSVSIPAHFAKCAGMLISWYKQLRLSQVMYYTRKEWNLYNKDVV